MSSTALGWFWSDNKQEWQLARVADEDRQLHCYVIGASGSGKTKFLEYLIRQDLQAGRGCGVIDPHGDLIEDLKGYVATLAPERGEHFLRSQIVLVDLADPRQTVTFNPIEQLPGVSAGEQAAELISAFRKIWADSWGVRMEDLMRNSLIALSEAERALVDLPAFLTDAGFRGQILTRLTHPIARDYFGRFNQLSDRARLTWSEPVLNKINALLANDHVRHLLAAPHSTVNLRQVMDQGHVLLVKLDKGRLKDSADLLGSLILAKLQLAVFSRSELPVWQRRPFALYVDEFQNFATASFGVLLSEARKYGLSLVLAHQTLAQIPEELTSLILGNTGLQVVFRVNRRDAERMAKESFSYSGYHVKSATLKRINYWSLGEEWEQYTAALQNQEPRSAWVKHKIQGGLIPIQTADVEPAWRALNLSRPEYQRHVQELPIGADYLRPRQATAPTSGSVPAAPYPRAAEPDPDMQTPAPLTPDEEAFLQVVLAHPDETISALYRRSGLSTGKAAQVRGALVEKGALVEIETRLGKGGRAAKFLLPSFATMERCGLVPPNGRGGPLHRHVQQLVAAEGTSKGYRAEVEFALPSGDAVDVHLSQGAELTAVEIWVGSRLVRELEHVENCLAAGYDHIICLVFAETMEADLRRALPQRFPDRADRVRVMPLKQVGNLL